MVSLRGSTGKEVVSISYRCIAVVAFLACASPLAAGQGKPALPSCSPAPCVLPPTQASESGRGDVTDTPITVDPLNPLNLLLGSVDANCPPPGLSGFHLSMDGGATWSRYCMPIIDDFHGLTYVPGGEPMVGYDRNGAAYIASGYGDNDGVGYGLIAVEKKAAGGNWGQPIVALSDGQNFPFNGTMAVDTSIQSPYVDSLYISAVFQNEPRQNKNQVVVAHSYDGGKTWTSIKVAPVQLSPAEDRQTAMTVGKDGTLYLSWEYCDMSGACGNDPAYMMFAKSGDGGNTWSKPTLVARVTLVYPLPNTQRLSIVNTPAAAVDNSSGPFAGSLYVVMYNWTGTFMQVQVVRSTDGGVTWSKPVPVAPGITHDQFLPWISVSPTGLVGVSWLDRRNDPKNVNYQAFAAISRDGGKSFQPNVQLTTAFSEPIIGMGNYTGDTWDGPNYFVAGWMDDSNGVDIQEEVGGIRLK